MTYNILRVRNESSMGVERKIIDWSAEMLINKKKFQIEMNFN